MRFEIQLRNNDGDILMETVAPAHEPYVLRFPPHLVIACKETGRVLRGFELKPDWQPPTA